jgi:hypothetical protein
MFEEKERGTDANNSRKRLAGLTEDHLYESLRSVFKDTKCNLIERADILQWLDEATQQDQEGDVFLSMPKCKRAASRHNGSTACCDILVNGHRFDHSDTDDYRWHSPMLAAYMYSRKLVGKLCPDETECDGRRVQDLAGNKELAVVLAFLLSGGCQKPCARELLGAACQSLGSAALQDAAKRAYPFERQPCDLLRKLAKIGPPMKGRGPGEEASTECFQELCGDLVLMLGGPGHSSSSPSKSAGTPR